MSKEPENAYQLFEQLLRKRMKEMEELKLQKSKIKKEEKSSFGK